MNRRGVSRLTHSINPEKETGEQTNADRKQNQRAHHELIIWVRWMVVLLGIWMVASPLTFDYGLHHSIPSGDREVWLDLTSRISVMKWSDILSGVALIILGWRALLPDRPYSIWMCCFVGIWISTAPIIFWSPSAAAYLNGTLVGGLLIAFTILIPGMPNMGLFMKQGPEVPPGWSYNPSSWAQRSIMIGLGFLGWIVSRYLSAYQLGYIDSLWDPFFAEGSIRVLNSSMSKSLPISDAGLGALAYAFEFLMGYMGGPARWRTMPWMVTLFGILVIPLGLTHIFLVISQPLVVGEWCTFCLVAALIMLPMIPLEIDEVIAMGQHVVQATRRGEKFWNVFWKGGTSEEMNADERSPELISIPTNFRKVTSAAFWGMSFPWTQWVSTLLGVWIMIAPDICNVDVNTPTADFGHLVGALIVVVAIVSAAEVVRVGRYLNVILGLLAAFVPWFLYPDNLTLNLCISIGGITVGILSIFKGSVREFYGSWDRYIR